MTRRATLPSTIATAARAFAAWWGGVRGHVDSRRTLPASLLLVAALLASAAARADGALALSDLGVPWFTTFSVRDGLPPSIMNSVAIDRDGFAWAASAEELARYDGSRWETGAAFTTKGTLGTLTTTHDGTLWAVFRDRGLARLDGGQWQFIEGSAELDPVALRETRDAQGRHNLWLLSFGAGPQRFDGTRWQPIVDHAQLPGGIVGIAQTATLGGRPRIWVGSVEHGLWFREEGGS